MSLTRRDLVRRAALGAAAASVVGPAPLLRSAAAATPSLKSLAQRSGRYYGTCASLGTLLTDDRYRTLVREQEWIASSPKARQAKSKARIKAYEQLVDAAEGIRPGDRKSVV